MSQKALILETPKTPFVLRSIPIPKPGPRELLVKLFAVGLNPSDHIVQFLDPIPFIKYPVILGFDAAGSVEEVGADVERNCYEKGDRVFFSPDFRNMLGGYQQYTLVSIDQVAKIPPNIGYTEAATLSSTFCTAVFPLFAPSPLGIGLNPTFDFTSPEIKNKHKGESALVIGGSSSVGQYSIQLLKSIGYTEIIVYASSKNSEYLKSLGATQIIDRSSVPLASLPSTVKSIASAPIKLVHVAYVPVVDTERIVATGYACLAPNIGGSMAVASPAPQKFDDAEETGRKVFGIRATTRTQPELGKLIWTSLPKMVEEGVIQPNRVEHVSNGLAGIPDALKRFAGSSAGVSGVKLVLNPQETPED